MVSKRIVTVTRKERILRTRTSHRRGLLRIALLAMILATPALSQPPRDTCDGSENLSGMDMLPQMLSMPAPMANNFTLPATCNEIGLDHVTCFAPQNNCTVNITCRYVPATQVVSANLMLGPCVTNPASCIGTATGTTATIVGASLTAGTQYCVVCESPVSITAMAIDIVQNTGNCGDLPVELQSVSIE
jgi:hypothetical protein